MLPSFPLLRREIPERELVKRTALESDTETVVSEPGVYCDNGVPKIIYGKLPGERSALAEAVKGIQYLVGERTGGLKATARTFGFAPRNTLRADFCTASWLSTEQPKIHASLEALGQELDPIYAESAPADYARHKEQLSMVKPDWVIPGTVFTSGIVNKNNSLKYHYDFGNFKDVMSCMVVLRRDCGGGMLSIPEYNVRFLLEDGAYFLFDGQKILHGVTAIEHKTTHAYRYSIVFYALRQMRNCGTPEEELARIRRLKREREKKRLEYKPA